MKRDARGRFVRLRRYVFVFDNGERIYVRAASSAEAAAGFHPLPHTVTDLDALALLTGGHEHRQPIEARLAFEQAITEYATEYVPVWMQRRQR